MASYRGKACKIVRTNGRHKTIRFNATGSEMTVPATRIVNAKKKNPARRKNAKKKNPYVSFEGHGGKHKRVRGKAAQRPGKRKGVRRAPVTFFVHKTRARGKYVSSTLPKGYKHIGRSRKEVLTKQAQSARQREQYMCAPGFAKLSIRQHLAKIRKHRK